MQHAISSHSLLVDPERHPLRPASAAGELGTVVAVAPHPDDESLGCGGLLAMVGKAGHTAHVLIMTDGSRSHPNSQSHPAPHLAALREQEALAAVEALGLPKSAVNFLRFRDCGLPAKGSPEFGPAAAHLTGLLATLRPQTLLVPWRRDPHCDHEATWCLLREAAALLDSPPRWLEYPIWAWPKAGTAIAPQESEATAWRLDIRPAIACKGTAIARHRSQLGAVIHDDPDGFILKPDMLAYFTRPWELFIEPTDV